VTMYANATTSRTIPAVRSRSGVKMLRLKAARA
jgi:hypothetical protein